VTEGVAVGLAVVVCVSVIESVAVAEELGVSVNDAVADALELWVEDGLCVCVGDGLQTVLTARS